MTILNLDAMSTLAFLANIADGVGAPATKWDAPRIIFPQTLSSRFPRPAKRLFVASEFAIVKLRASQLDTLATPSNGCARLARHVTSHSDAYL